MLVMYTDLRAVWYPVGQTLNQCCAALSGTCFLFGALVQMTLTMQYVCRESVTEHWGL
jgi:hypothetical protein